MEVEIKYSVFQGRRMAEAEVGENHYCASGDTWPEAKVKLIGAIRDALAIEAPPPTEIVTL